MLTLHRRRPPHAHAPDDGPDRPEHLARPVDLADDLAGMGAAVAFVSDGRYRAAAPDENAGILIIRPRSRAELRALRRRDPDRCIVVWDPSATTLPSTVAANLEAGADAYVSGASVKLLVGHLDAVERRRRR